MTDITDGLLIGGGMRQTYAEYRAEIGELLEKAEAEITRLRLTDAEREAVAWAARRLSDDPMLPQDRPTAATLRGLLERLGGER